MTKIQVTQEHINKGKRMKACECPVALAIRDKTKWIPDVSSLIVTFPGTLDTEWLPAKAAEFVNAFDSGNPVKPFEFEMKLPEDTEQ